MVGRLDIKGDGAAGALEASALRLEPRRRLTAVRNRLLEAELERTRFAGLDVVRLEDGYVKSGG